MYSGSWKWKFHPILFSIYGGMGKEANKCYSWIAKKLVEKRDKPHLVMSWIWRKASFSMMKLSICVLVVVNRLTLSWQRPLSYRNQSIDLQSKSLDWFLYDNSLRHERVKHEREKHNVKELASYSDAQYSTMWLIKEKLNNAQHQKKC